jgi:HSF-type DNA-binding
MEKSSADDRTNEGKSFASVLYVMLEEVDNKGWSHIVSWQPHGRAFLVHKKKEFVKKIMPR